MKPTIKTDISRFNRAMKGLANEVNVSTGKFIKTEGKALSGKLTESFTPKKRKSEKGMAIDRRVAFRTRVRSGGSTIPWKRLEQVINRRRPSGAKPTVQVAVAKASLARGIKRLGTLAAGFIGRGNKLGVKAKGYVMHNVGHAYGDVTIKMGLIFKSVRLRNWTPWLRNMKGAEFVVARAIRSRTSAMRKNTQLITKGVKKYWKRS